MIRVDRYQTSDGVVHATRDKADSHADKRYGAALSTLAHRLVAIDKYHHMLDFLDVDDNLKMFANLAAIKADMKLVKEEDGTND